MDKYIPDNEEEQLKLAIAMSLQEAGNGTDPPQHENSGRPSGILGLDRKTMEEERLARLQAGGKGPDKSIASRKRVADEPPGISAHGICLPEHSDTQPSASNKKPRLQEFTKAATLRYPKGAILKTWCYGFDRTGQDIKIEEVLDKHNLQLAVLSSFQWDVDWVFSKLNPSTKLVFVMQAKDESIRDQYRRETADIPNLRLCFPPMPGNVNCMHSKLMLLSFPGFLRIVIPTANLVAFDWGETGTMENSAFVLDVPRFQDDHRPTEQALPMFAQDLLYFCQALGLSNDIVQSIRKFNFSQAEQLALVHSIGGEHRDDWRRTGYPGLGRAVQQIGAATSNNVEIDFVASSVGAVNEDLVNMISLACKGNDGSTEYNERTSRAKKKDGTEPTAKTKNSLRVYFPSFTTVHQSRGGPDHAGTVCFQKRWYDSAKFPKTILRDCRSVRSGLLMHNKMIFVKTAPNTDQVDPKTVLKQGQPPQSPMDGKIISWIYIGSANFSESAWGRLVQDRTTKKPKLTCRNWECGVVMRCTQEEAHLPMELPAPVISECGLSPWFYSET